MTTEIVPFDPLDVQITLFRPVGYLLVIHAAHLTSAPRCDLIEGMKRTRGATVKTSRGRCKLQYARRAPRLSATHKKNRGVNMSELITALVSGAVLVIGSVAMFITTWLKQKSMQNELDGIRKALANSSQLYYISCPNCGHKIYLNSVTINTEQKTTTGGITNATK